MIPTQTSCVDDMDMSEVRSSVPVLPEETLRHLADEALRVSSADIAAVVVHHDVSGVTRVSDNHVRVTNDGDTLHFFVTTRLGGRGAASVVTNQIDSASIRDAMVRADAMAQQMPGDAAPVMEDLPLRPRRYRPNTVWYDGTAMATGDARQSVVPALLDPLRGEAFHTAAFVGAYAHATVYADKQGVCIAGRETDAELNVTSWCLDGTDAPGGSGWAGQAARDWRVLDPAAVGAHAARLATLSVKTVAFEPGRRIAILDRPAVAQMVRAMGRDYDAQATHLDMTPLSRLKIGARVWDERMTLSSDPNDPEGGYLPFNNQGFPLSPMTWVSAGHFASLAYDAYYAAQMTVTPSNDWPTSLRLQAVSGQTTSVEDMIAGAKEAIYVNRLADITVVQSRTGLMTGVTTGGCFLVQNGQITKSIKNFRFVESMYFILNRLLAVGASARAPMGYAPWHGDWPIAPTIVPPLMISDFNFVALADAV